VQAQKRPERRSHERRTKRLHRFTNVGGELVVSATVGERQSPVPALKIQMLKLDYNLLDEDRKQQLLDYAQTLIEEQRTERGAAATA
jgi:hypothetical protein